MRALDPLRWINRNTAAIALTDECWSLKSVQSDVFDQARDIRGRSAVPDQGGSAVEVAKTYGIVRVFRNSNVFPFFVFYVLRFCGGCVFQHFEKG